MIDYKTNIRSLIKLKVVGEENYKDSTAGKTLTLCIVDLSLIQGFNHGSLNPRGVIPCTQKEESI